MPRAPEPRRVRVVRYVLGGKHVKKGTPGAKRVSTLSETYYAKIGGKRVSLHAASKADAWDELNRLLREGADPAAAHRKRPLAEHLDAFEAHLQGKNITAKRRTQVMADLRRIAQEASWGKLADCTADGLRAALERARGRGRGAETRKMYRQHWHQFGRWCVRTGRLGANPFAEVERPNAAADRRHLRRCPTDDELRQLWLYLGKPTCPVRRGMSGRQRMLGYKVAVGTGFRAGELRELERGYFDLDAGTVKLPAREDKRGKPVVQPLPAWLVAELRDWFAAGGGTWQGFPARDPGQVLEADLHAAGIPYSLPGPDGPEFLDMHSLRVRYITDLASQPGIDPKTLMQLARHSDPRLTLAVYARAKGENARAAVERLPRPGEP